MSCCTWFKQRGRRLETYYCGKPFGYDAKTAKQLDVQIIVLKNIRSIIDHSEETVQNLLVLRFSNGSSHLEP